MSKPTKTAELEAKLNEAMAVPGLSHALPLPSIAAFALAGDDPITFQEPLASWGTVTHCLMPNPKWRWWAFWRPRTLVFEMPVHAPGIGPCEITITEG